MQATAVDAVANRDRLTGGDYERLIDIVIERTHPSPRMPQIVVGQRRTDHRDRLYPGIYQHLIHFDQYTCQFRPYPEREAINRYEKAARALWKTESLSPTCHQQDNHGPRDL